MPFQPGQSGNPGGRPPKSRALTMLLEAAGAKTLVVGGKKVSGKRLVAALAWELAATGRVTLPDGTALEATAKDLLDVWKWIFAQIDGPPKQSVDLTSDGKPLSIRVEWEDLGDADR